MNSATGWPKGNPRRGAGVSLSRRGRTGFRSREGDRPGGRVFGGNRRGRRGWPSAVDVRDSPRPWRGHGRSMNSSLEFVCDVAKKEVPAGERGLRSRRGRASLGPPEDGRGHPVWRNKAEGFVLGSRPGVSASFNGYCIGVGRETGMAAG